MKNKIFKNYLKDHLFFTMVYFVSNFFIALFYFLSSGKRLEIAYPFYISLFFYVIFMLYKWITYYEFNKKIEKLRNNINYDIETYSCEEKKLVKLIYDIHGDYLQKISKIELKNKNEKKFLSQWIHNMKTPVTVIDLIYQKTLNNEIEIKKALSNIKEENVKLLNNLEQVLNLIRLEDFANDYEPETIDLIASVRNVINRRKNQFIYSNVYPRLETFEDNIMVLSDKKWNEAMIEQIVSNAIKYSIENGKSKNIYFSVKRDNKKVLLSIRDEGIGIPDYDIGRVFQPFFTGDNGRNYPNATGIGLYFCSCVAKWLGHTIKINSKKGIGTEVIITYLAKL